MTRKGSAATLERLLRLLGGMTNAEIWRGTRDVEAALAGDGFGGVVRNASSGQDVTADAGRKGAALGI